MPTLVATHRLSYGVRRLQAEEAFSASKQDARVLVALGRARYQTTQTAPDVTVVAVPADEASALQAAEQQPARRCRPAKARAK